jgi:ferredoxin-type protein NapH
MTRPRLRTYRRITQTSVALAFVLIPWLNHIHISFVYGNFLAFRLGPLPLADPLAVLQITLKNSWLAADLLIGAGIALVLAAALGTVFCSWACPFGLLSELTQQLYRRPRDPVRRLEREGIRRGFRVKFILFGLGLAGFLLFSTTPALNQLSLPAWYSRIFQFWFEQRHLSAAILTLLAVLAVELAAGRRLWCRYVCPQSVLISLAKQVNRRHLHVRFDPGACLCKGDKDPCRRACSLALDPKTLLHWPENECTNCGDCITACKPRGRALTFGFNPRQDQDRK